MPGLLYADDLVLWSALERDLKKMTGSFVTVCRKIGLKVNRKEQGDRMRDRYGRFL